MNLDSGGRGGRGKFAELLLSQLCGAEEALAVNNCSAALVLALKTFAGDRKVAISRGELVQIGGGFRIPEILEVSGARLSEVGTTNRTSLEDYREALENGAEMILSVHRSNFDMEGFTESPPIDELADLASEYDVHYFCDLGSGALVETERYGLPHELQPSEVIEQGADAVLFSGDKLLGGPQAGIILGGEDTIEAMRQHPMFRALRCGKAALTVLESTMQLYASDRLDEIPVYRMLGTSTSELQQRAEEIADDVDHEDVQPIETTGTVGGGALPETDIDSMGIAVETSQPEQLRDQLRSCEPPVIGTIRDDQLRLNLLTVFPDADQTLVSIIREIV
jgi:L-seryl-tRNA(Ser) seleniumtransferase